MRSRGPALIVSLPARSIRDAREQLRRARRAGADVAEIRVDRLGHADQRRLERLFPSPLPLLATARSRAEGGEGPDAEGPRRRLLDELRRLPFDWIDREAARDKPPTGRTPSRYQREIVSTHYFRLPRTRVLVRALGQKQPPQVLRKIVFPAGLDRLLESVLPVLPHPLPPGSIVHTTGPSGPLLRIWGRRMGQAGVFGSLPEISNGGIAADPPVEPAQVPIDRLRAVFSRPRTARTFALLGSPAGRSRSPSIHNHWMRSEGRAGCYVALEPRDAQEFARVVPVLFSEGFRGFNVTHPYKMAAMALASRLSPGALASGCANTLSARDGEVVAENTDYLAVLRRLEELRRAKAWAAKELIVLGTGGAARAALSAARTLGVPRRVRARRPVAGRLLADEFGATVSVAPDEPSSLFIHATPVGMVSGPRLDFPFEDLVRRGTFVLDFVYDPATPLLAQTARRKGARYEDGRRLLVHQAAESYRIWWGARPSARLLREAVEAP